MLSHFCYPQVYPLARKDHPDQSPTGPMEIELEQRASSYRGLGCGSSGGKTAAISLRPHARLWDFQDGMQASGDLDAWNNHVGC